MFMIRFAVFLSLAVFVYVGPVYADEADAAFERRLVLARQMNDIRPARQQVEEAVDMAIVKLSMNDRDVFKEEILSSFDFEKLEKLSVGTMTDIFAENELQRMVDYFGATEAQSISRKQKIYQQILQPEIIKTLDRAFMKIRTGKSQTR